MSPSGRLKVLVYTTLFPNSVEPLLGNFVYERMRHLLQFVDISVVAPVPYFPGWINVNKRWLDYSRIPRAERISGFETQHPRYIVLPKIGMATHGVSMFVGSVRQVWKRLRETEYDLIDAHYVYPDGFAAAMLAGILHKPLVVSARGSDINQFSQFPVIRPLLRQVLHRADALIAVSQGLRDRMVGLGCSNDSVSVIGNGVDPLKFRPESSPAMREMLGLPVDRLILIGVGRLNENKGFHILIDAVGRLKAAGKDALLLIVGDGPHRQRLEKQIQQRDLANNVRLIGPIPNDHLSSWYNAADVFCLASSREGCPNVVLEAMACGKPIVATRVGSVPELVASPLHGILVDRTPESFGSALSEALMRDWNHDAITNHARSYAWDHVSAQVLNVYSRALERFQAKA